MARLGSAASTTVIVQWVNGRARLQRERPCPELWRGLHSASSSASALGTLGPSDALL